jgi:hypothetical protein
MRNPRADKRSGKRNMTVMRFGAAFCLHFAIHIVDYENPLRRPGS